MNDRVHHLAALLRAERALPGLPDLVPAYATLAVHFDPAWSAAAALPPWRAALERLWRTPARGGPRPGGWNPGVLRRRVRPRPGGGGRPLRAVRGGGRRPAHRGRRTGSTCWASPRASPTWAGWTPPGRAPPRDRPGPGCPRDRWASPGRRPASTPWRPPAAGGSSGARRGRSSTPARRSPACCGPATSASCRPFEPARMSLLVEIPGLLTTVQDLGRPGCQHLGLGPGGRHGPRFPSPGQPAGGQRPGAATLEITLAGPTLVFEEDALVALCGADLSAEVEGQPVPLWRPVLVRAGARLTFGAPVEGCRVPTSPWPAASRSPRSWAAAAPARRGLRRLPGPDPASRATGWTRAPRRERYPALRRRFDRSASPASPRTGSRPGSRSCTSPGPRPAAHPGPAVAGLTAASRAASWSETFQVAPDSDRMGLRLRGPSWPWTAPGDAHRPGGHGHPAAAPRRRAHPAHGRPPDHGRLPAPGRAGHGGPAHGRPAARPGSPCGSPPSTLGAAQDLLLAREARFAPWSGSWPHWNRLDSGKPP